MKIGLIQFAPVLGDLPATMQKIEALAPSIADFDLVVLPELCNSGYNFESKEQAWGSSEEAGKGPFSELLIGLCRKHGQHIVSGLNERSGDVLYNSAILMGPNGLIGTYRKLHLFLNEKDFFEPGNLGLPVFDVGSSRIGILICFDWQYPEVWRVLALKGADIICHPSNLVLPGRAQRGVPVHAMLNRIFVLTANRVGTERGLNFTGNSIICDPTGAVITQGPKEEEIVVSAEIDPTWARDKNVTERNHLFNDRRPEFYTLLVGNHSSGDGSQEV